MSRFAALHGEEKYIGQGCSKETCEEGTREEGGCQEETGCQEGSREEKVTSDRRRRQPTPSELPPRRRDLLFERSRGGRGREEGHRLDALFCCVASGPPLTIDESRGTATMAILHKYVERGADGFANLSLASGERILLSPTANGLRVHRLHLAGLVPGKTFHVADARALDRIVRILGRDLERLPQLPNDAATQALIVGAAAALTDPGKFGRGPVEDSIPATPLSIVTRAAPGQEDSAALVRLYTRAANTP